MANRKHLRILKQGVETWNAWRKQYEDIILRPDLGCRTFLSCISKGFGGFCSRLLRLRTGKLSSAFRLHGFADIF